MEPDPIVEAPDWSFADGRPAPLLKGQRRRMIYQMHYAKIITELLQEVDFAEKRHERIRNEKDSKDHFITETKLREKGKSRYTAKNKSHSNEVQNAKKT